MTIPLSVVTKPTGAACNLDCQYCFFLSKELLYDDKSQRMSEDLLDLYVRRYLEAQADGEVTFLWQGGEPTLRGRDFFVKAFALAEKYQRPGQKVSHALQTNATLIDRGWAELLAQYDVLVGVSLDGPESLHDAYRVNRAGRGTHAQVVRGWRILQETGVRTNVLCTVHAANQDYGVEVYRYFRDTLGAEFMQFIPIVERVDPGQLSQAEHGWSQSGLLYSQNGTAVTSRSVEPQAYGRFLKNIFEEWITHDVGKVFVQDFDAALGAMFGMHSVCVHAPECGNNLAMEFNGDVYSCDHWVEPDWLLGNITQDRFEDLVQTPTAQAFALKKNVQLSKQCQDCPVRRFCNGGCPKDRFVDNPGDQPQNYLCPGFFDFYTTIKPDLIAMARLLRRGETADKIMEPGVREELRPALPEA